MSKKNLSTLTLILAVVFLAGCTGSGGVKARSYVTVRDRVDQNMQSGEYNYGYLSGTPVPENRDAYRKTRKVYVMEFTKELDEEEMPAPYQPPARRSAPVDDTIRVERKRPQPKPEPERIVIPDFDDEEYYEEDAAAGTGSFQEYTIQKGDTLQKISKKFYDSYSKWTKIYDVNKDVLKDPNRIKPGVTIKIPEL